MKIRELSIKNCLSFGDKGMNADNRIDLGDLNLFIGSNNAGKSNVLKMVKVINVILFSLRQSGKDSLSDIPLSFDKAGINTLFEDWIYAQDLTHKIHFSFSLEIEENDKYILYSHNNVIAPIIFSFELKKSWPKRFSLTGYIEFKGEFPHITVIRVEIPNDRREPIIFDLESKTCLVITVEPGGRHVWKMKQHPEASSWDNNRSHVEIATIKFISRLYDEIIQNLCVNISAIREIRPDEDIITALIGLRDGRREQRELFFSVRDFLRELIFNYQDHNMDLVFPVEKASGKHGVEIDLGRLQLPLSHYGSGVEQMLFLAAEIVRNGNNKIILIEEPEAHLHPELQRKLVRFLMKNQGIFRHQYLIATHSNIFIDEFLDMQQNVFYVYVRQEEASEITYSQVELLNRGHEKLPALLRDLGAKPSDILMANGVLVVEGPTDKAVYMDWARKIGKPFEEVALEVIDVEGAGNISKYLTSAVIQRSCFRRHALCDKNAESDIRKKLEKIVPKENIIALQKGDLEDYYPRELVLQFAKYWAGKKNTLDKVPSEIEEGRTVEILNRLLGEDWWKTKLAEQVIKEMKPDEIHVEVKQEISKIYDSLA